MRQSIFCIFYIDFNKLVFTVKANVCYTEKKLKDCRAKAFQYIE